MNKSRKPLNESLASDFVYGSKELEAPPPATTPAQEEKLSLKDKLQPVQAKEPTKRFTVDLPESLHKKLSILSAQTGRTKAEIVRTLLQEVLEDFDD